MRFVDIIEKKKHGQALTQKELHYFIQGYLQGNIPDYQVSALLMAIYFQGMDEQETALLCEEMLNSGSLVDLSSIEGVKCDKHSTGGVGDKTTLALAPMVASCGVKIAKMSGRGLGHTGGTLDKLESIHGFCVQLSQEAFIAQVNRIGIAVIGQSQELAPADKMLYALRDVTGTVDSIPLIASSIMSKKLAAGTDTILLDVKYGEGAFMPTPEKAIALANAMISIGHHFHKDVRAMISNMNEPLGNAIGNALEVKEAIATLQGKGPKDFTELCLRAGSIILQQAGIESDERVARARLQRTLSDGTALKKLCEMVHAQKGDVDQILHPEKLPQAKEVVCIPALQSGYVKELHALELGRLAMALGAGRMVKEDQIDPSVGIVLNKKAGDYVEKGEPLAYIHIHEQLSEEWRNAFYDAYSFCDQYTQKEDLIYQVISS